MQETEFPKETVRSRTIEKLNREIGPIIRNALSDSKTVEVLLNADGKIWHERLGEKMIQIGEMKSCQAESIIKTVAGFHAKEITKFKPLIEGILPIDGSRFAAQLPPIVLAPTFAIRKKASSVFTLSQYIDCGIMTDAQSKIIKDAIYQHKNILIIGGTGSGKTTLVNAIIQEMVDNDPNERVVIIEDTGEIQCKAINSIQYYTSEEVNMTHLLKTTLRMRPDRILVGEVRGEEALDLLDAWNTGHEGGVATLHANNSTSALKRLKSLITRNKSAPNDIDSLIGEVVHFIIHISRTNEGRKVKEILEIQGYQNHQYVTKQW